MLEIVRDGQHLSLVGPGFNVFILRNGLGQDADLSNLIDWLEENYPTKTAEEWAELKGDKIMDPDGWRRDNKPFDSKITEAEYYQRIRSSTCCYSLETLRFLHKCDC